MDNLKCVICGMFINESNLNLNSNAMLNKNDKERILTCPFCGASHELLEKEGEVIGKGYFGRDEFITKILDHAMKLEIFNGEFYKKASVLASNEKVKRMFEDLSRIEFMHARIHQRLGGFAMLPVLREMDYSKYTEDSELLAAAKKREEHAVAYYRKYMAKVSDQALLKIFSILAEIEAEHITLTAV